MGFSKQKYWSGLSFPSPGDLPDPGIDACTGKWILYHLATWEAQTTTFTATLFKRDGDLAFICHGCDCVGLFRVRSEGQDQVASPCYTCITRGSPWKRHHCYSMCQDDVSSRLYNQKRAMLLIPQRCVNPIGKNQKQRCVQSA